MYFYPRLILTAAVTATLVFAIPSPKGKRLIQTSETNKIWLTETEVNQPIEKNTNFFNITDHQTPTKINHPVGTFVYPEELKYHIIGQIISEQLSIPRMVSFLTEFSSFYNRYYDSQNGVDSSDWLLEYIRAAVATNGCKGRLTVEPFTHSWPQNSIIVRIEGTDPVLRKEIIVLGAHQDSINSGNPTEGYAPGADDDGSGATVLLESFLAIIGNGWIPKRTIEWQWYAAEEVGLRGSQDIATAYNEEGRNVIAMLNLDCVGYFVGTTGVRIRADYGSMALTEFLGRVVKGYLNEDYNFWTTSQCGYACSDHASWNRTGYPATSPAEPISHPEMHTVRDTIDRVNFEQMKEFAKLMIGAIVELQQ